MTRCALCQNETAAEDLDRVSGLDLCASCCVADPAASLAALGIPAEWDTGLGRFSAGLGIAGQDEAFFVKWVPERLAQKLAKLVAAEVEVGDPAFDDHIYIRTSDPGRAQQVLAHDGVQSALLSLLTGTRPNELAGHHVTLTGPTLTVSVRPAGGLTPERQQKLKLQTAALALHLRHLG